MPVNALGPDHISDFGQLQLLSWIHVGLLVADMYGVQSHQDRQMVAILAQR
jgi:hypothetical protein